MAYSKADCWVARKAVQKAVAMDSLSVVQMGFLTVLWRVVSTVVRMEVQWGGLWVF